MSRERLVAVSYPADEDYARIDTEVLGGDASVVFLGDAPATALARG